MKPRQPAFPESPPCHILSVLPSRRSLNVDVAVSGAAVALGGDNHVVVVAHAHAGALPGLEELARVDGAAVALLLADGPVLLEGAGPLDGGLVDARRLVQSVGAAGGLERAARLRAVARVVLAVVLEDVVLHERVLSPAVDAEVLLGGGVSLSAQRGTESKIKNDAKKKKTLTALPLLTGLKVPEYVMLLEPPGIHPLPPTKLPPDCH